MNAPISSLKSLERQIEKEGFRLDLIRDDFFYVMIHTDDKPLQDKVTEQYRKQTDYYHKLVWQKFNYRT